MASSTGLPCCSIACICSVIGISTPTFLCQADGGIGGEHTFGDHAMHAGDDVIQLAPPSQFYADGFDCAKGRPCR